MEHIGYTNTLPKPANLDAIFSALADPTRRAILSKLAAGEASVNEIAQPFAIRYVFIVIFVILLSLTATSWFSKAKLPLIYINF